MVPPEEGEGRDPGLDQGMAGAGDEPEPPGTEVAEERRRRGRLRVWVQRGVLVLLLLVGLGVLTFFFLIQTQTGQRLVLRELLRRSEGMINGEILVEDIRSRDLRYGATLVGLRIEGPDGEPFLVADSVRAAYGWRTFLAGDVMLSDVTIWSPHVRVVREPGEEAFNAELIFASEEPDTAPPSDRTVLIEDAVVVDGRVLVRDPQDEPIPDRVIIERPDPDGPPLRRMIFEGVNGAFPRALLAAPDLEGMELDVASLATVARVWEEPGYLRDLVGRVTYGDGQLGVDAERLVLGESEASGTIIASFDEETGLTLALDVTTPEAHLADLQFIEPRIPDGIAEGRVELVLTESGQDWTFEGARADLGESIVTATGGVTMAGEDISFQALELDMSPLDLDRLRPWTDAEIPVEGIVRGNVSLQGDPANLQARGRLTLDEPGTGPPVTTADFEGTFHLGEDLGVTALQATLDPLDYELIGRLVPGQELGGTGQARVRATGTLDTGVRFEADVVHRDEGVPTSMLVVEGSIREQAGETVLDLTADVEPLSFTALRRYYPQVPVSGEVRGMIRATGPLSDLSVVTDLETEAGRLAVEARFDAMDPGASYRVEGEVSDFVLSRLMPDLPDPTRFTGGVFVEGRGLDLSTANIQARLRARQARVGQLDVDTALISVRVAQGRLFVDTLDALLDGTEIRGSGDLAVEEPASGTVRIAFETDSIGRFRPLILGDTVIARDDLQGLEAEWLRLEGIDPDTLPLSEEVRMEGAASGEVQLNGSLERFSAEGEVDVERFVYGTSSVHEARILFSATDLPSLSGEIHAELEADSLRILDRSFAGATLEVDYTEPAGRASMRLVRSEEEDYQVRVAFEVDTLATRVELEEMVLRFDTIRWELARTAAISWEGTGVTVQDLEMVRPGPDPMRILADGTLPTEGEADFILEVEGLQLERLASLAQREDMALEGIVSVQLEVRGQAEAPLISGTISARDLVWENLEVDVLEGDLGYADRRIRIDLRAEDDGLEILTATGTVPANLALTEVEDRFPEEEIDLAVSADSLPASLVLTVLEDLEEVEGTVNGDFAIRGTVESPEATGTVELNAAAFTLPALGVRYRDVGGTLTLQEDATVAVDATARADGTMTVGGTIRLEPLTDPTFDLVLSMNGFRAVDRRDVEGRVSGELTLTGAFSRPLIRGLAAEGRGLTVVEGTLFMEEFLRSSTVVDLSDPRYFAVLDTTLLEARPIIQESQNPFLQNLRVQVDLDVAQNTWLRMEGASALEGGMNVEIGGNLIITYDRQVNELVLVGDLEALRGDYTLLGRRFQVTSGIVEFVGTPGIDPNLDIQARTDVRRPEGGSGEPIEIVANVTGRLNNPRVELTSPAGAVAEQDLVSYLLFGRPTYALTSGQAASARGATQLLGETAFSVVGGTLASQLGGVVAREIGVDYFAISQPENYLGGGVGAGLTRTRVETGFYVPGQEDLFVILVLRPLQGAAQQFFGGVRLEWTASRDYTVELFIEDRFLRSAVGFQELGIQPELVYGFLVVREWGY